MLRHSDESVHCIDTSTIEGALTWYTADVYTSAAFLEGREASMSKMGLGVLPDAAVQGTLLGLQHGRQACMGQTLHDHALH